jgi:hypothetical protein
MHNYSRHRFAVPFLFGGVYTMRFQVHRQAMYAVQHFEISHPPMVFKIVFVEDGNIPAVTGHVNATLPIIP